MSGPARRGDLVAGTLSGSWRAEPTAPVPTPEEIAEIAPVLLATGAAGLGWWRIAKGTSARGEAGRTLHDAFRLQTLDVGLHETRLVRAVEVMTEGGVDFAVGKGWTVARLYARPGLRPYGDLDLFVSPEHQRQAVAAVAAHAGEGLRIDLHAGVPLLRRPWDEIRERVEHVALGNVSVPVLGAEDHLTLLCVHLLFHGAWRPAWLCDVAAFVEALPETFDWSRVGRASPRQRAQCRAVVLLAGRLLGADLGRTPWAGAAETLPRWLPIAVLRAWGAGGHYSVTTRFGRTEPQPRALMRALRVRWPNPVEATYRWSAPFNGLPRLPFQLMDVVARGARLLAGR